MDADGIHTKSNMYPSPSVGGHDKLVTVKIKKIGIILEFKCEGLHEIMGFATS